MLTSTCRIEIDMEAKIEKSDECRKQFRTHLTPDADPRSFLVPYPTASCVGHNACTSPAQQAGY